MPYSPMIKGWGLYFVPGRGFFSNRLSAMNAILSFLDNHEERIDKMPGSCLIGGDIYGFGGLKDGSFGCTTQVVSIERIVLREEDSSSAELLKVTTEYDTVYYCDPEDRSGYMNAMLNDLREKKVLLGNSPWYYINIFRGR